MGVLVSFDVILIDASEITGLVISQQSGDVNSEEFDFRCDQDFPSGKAVSLASMSS